jgi:hypothetical protein
MYNPSYFNLDLDTSQSHIENRDQFVQEDILGTDDQELDTTPRVKKEFVIGEDGKSNITRARVNNRNKDNITENPFMKKRSSK